MQQNMFANVYSPLQYGEKMKLWRTLLGRKYHGMDKCSVIGGGFNMILDQMEERGGSIMRDQFREKMEA